eukprot:scaffold1591_cov109-Isochrysis_galbana.AAC.5
MLAARQEKKMRVFVSTPGKGIGGSRGSMQCAGRMIRECDRGGVEGECRSSGFESLMSGGYGGAHPSRPWHLVCSAFGHVRWLP